MATISLVSRSQGLAPSLPTWHLVYLPSRDSWCETPDWDSSPTLHGHTWSWILPLLLTRWTTLGKSLKQPSCQGFGNLRRDVKRIKCWWMQASVWHIVGDSHTSFSSPFLAGLVSSTKSGQSFVLDSPSCRSVGKCLISLSQFLSCVMG